jgi:hypothetical protein
MRDSEVVGLAEAFLTLGEGQRFEVEDDRDGGATDVLLRVFFADGYGLDQVAATLEPLDTILTAGFIAAEARATGQGVTAVFDRLISDDDPLDIVWEVDSVEVGSLDLQAVIRRTGGWVSRHEHATLWVISGVAVLLPVVGLPAITGLAPWILAGAVERLAYLSDRRLQRGKVRGSKAGGSPAPEIQAELVEAREVPAAAAPEAVARHVDVFVSGPDSAKEAFVEAVRAIPGVERQSRLLEAGQYAGRVVRVWSATPVPRSAFSRIAEATGVTLDLD